MKTIRLVIASSMALGYVAFVCYFYLSPNPQALHVGSNDKLAHLMGFAAGSILLLLNRRLLPSSLNLFLAAFLIVGPFGLEWLQKLVPTRTFDYHDMAANLAGVLLPLLLLLPFKGKKGPHL